MATVAKDYYRVLGLPSDSDGGTIERAYRAIVTQIDAEIDANGDTDTLRLLRQEIEEAYQVLSNLTQRQDYDELRRDRLWWCDTDDAESAMDDDDDWTIDLDSALRRFLNVAASGRGQEVVEILLPFEVAALGGQAQISMPVRAACSDCGGTGGAHGQAYRCTVCRGDDDLRPDCRGCNGKGWIILSPCPPCGGQGWLGALGQLDLDIPPGVADGTLLPFPGFDRSTIGSSIPQYVRVKVSRHPFFSRRGRDIVCRVPVSEKVAKSGTTLHVRTLRGRRHEVVVPPDTSDGTIVRLEGEGIESEGQRGDQLIEIRVKGSSRKKTGGMQ